MESFWQHQGEDHSDPENYRDEEIVGIIYEIWGSVWDKKDGRLLDSAESMAGQVFELSDGGALKILAYDDGLTSTTSVRDQLGEKEGQDWSFYKIEIFKNPLSPIAASHNTRRLIRFISRRNFIHFINKNVSSERLLDISESTSGEVIMAIFLSYCRSSSL